VVGLRDLRKDPRELLKISGGKAGLRYRLRAGRQLFWTYAVALPDDDDSSTGDDPTGNSGNSGNIAGQGHDGRWEQRGNSGNTGIGAGQEAAEAGNTPVAAEADEVIATAGSALTCDVPTSEAVPSGERVPSPDMLPTGNTGGNVVPLGQRDQRRAAQRAELAEQLASFRRVIERAIEKTGKFPNLTDADLVAGLKTFSVALDGLSFAGHPARVGQLLYEKLAAQYARIPTLDAPPDQPVNAGDVQTMFNFLDQSVDVTAHRYVVGLDVNAQFLAASGVELGTGEPRPMVLGPDQLVAELKLPGYVQLGQPYKVGPRCTLAAGQWIANPMAVYLAQRGGLAVADGWVWPEHRRWLNAWKSAMLRARKDLMAREDLPSRLALVALKSVYAAFLGGWMNSGEDKGGHNKTHTLRPDWMHMVHSTARANALRALDKASVAPFATLADAAYFLVDDPMDPKGLTLSTQPGKWKAHRIGRTTDTTWTTNRRTGKAVGTTLAELVERGQLGSISEAIQHLDEIYRGAVSA
jgi:hypothetical protein